MKIVLKDGMIEYEGDEVNLIKGSSELIRNYMKYFNTNDIEIKEISVKEFEEWMKEMKEYIMDVRKKTTRTNEYLCGMNMEKKMWVATSNIKLDNSL